MKTVATLIRHGQSVFNQFYDENGFDPGMPDPSLTERGKDQARKLRYTFHEEEFDALVVSPLSRSIDTGLIALGARNIPVIVEPSHRECLWMTCDVGLPKSELQKKYPDLNFESISDVWWYKEKEKYFSIEPGHELIRRVLDFRKFLQMLPYRKVAVVGHGNFWKVFAHAELGNTEFVQFEV